MKMLLTRVVSSYYNVLCTIKDKNYHLSYIIGLPVKNFVVSKQQDNPPRISVKNLVFGEVKNVVSSTGPLSAVHPSVH